MIKTEGQESQNYLLKHQISRPTLFLYFADTNNKSEILQSETEKLSESVQN